MRHIVGDQAPDAGFSALLDQKGSFCCRDHGSVACLHPAERGGAFSYENGNAFELIESSGVLDLTKSVYAANADGRTVRVSGSSFRKAPVYTVKLEGAEKVGYMSVIVAGMRDPYIIRQIDDWLARLKEKVRLRVVAVYGEEFAKSNYTFNVRVYGKNAVMGPMEPVKEIRGHEIGLIMEITSTTEEVASSIASMTRHQALHLPIPEWDGAITTIALPYNPSYLERGALFRFNMNHVVEIDDPCEMFPIEYFDL